MSESEKKDFGKLHKKHFDEIGERMKGYEKENESKIDETKPFIIRLDGHTFHTFASCFEKPFDSLCKQIIKNYQ